MGAVDKNAESVPMQTEGEACPRNMEQGWYDMLVRKEIPQTLIEYMSTDRINNMASLPRYCLTKQDIMDILIDNCKATAGCRSLMVPLVELWDLASAANTASASGTAKGMTEEEMELPLDTAVVTDLHAKHKAAYGYSLSSF